MEKRIFRSRNDRLVAGVCAGIADYFNMDPTLVRIITVVLAFATLFTTAIIYLICAVVMPEGETHFDGTSTTFNFPGQTQTKKILGIGLIIIGVVIAMERLVGWFDRGVLAAIAIIAVGVIILVYNNNNKQP